MTAEEQRWIEAGDPTFLGWLTAAIYLLAALLSLRAWWKFRTRGSGLQALLPETAGLERLATWWLGVAALMILLGTNKELDLLQKLVRVWGKAAALRQGWYANRAVVEHAFVALLATLLAGAGGIALYYFRGVAKHIIPSLTGIALVLAYALLRTAMFNGLCDSMPAQLTDLLWLLEPAGILLVILCAVRAPHTGVQPS